MKFRPFGTPLGNTIERTQACHVANFREDCEEPGYGRRALGRFGGTAERRKIGSGRDGMRLPEPLLQKLFRGFTPHRSPVSPATAVLRATPAVFQDSPKLPHGSPAMKHTLIVGERSRQIFLDWRNGSVLDRPDAGGFWLTTGRLSLRIISRVLKAGAPDENYRFVGSNAPGQLFLPGEQPALKFDFAKGGDRGTVRDFAVEIQEITTRDPDARSKGGFTDTSGNAPLIAVAGPGDEGAAGGSFHR